MPFVDFLLVLATAYAAAILFFFVRTRGTWPRSILFVLLGAIVLGSAVGMGEGPKPVRCPVGLLLIILLLHMWDLHLDPCRATRLSFKSYLVFLADFAWSVARIVERDGMNLSRRQRAVDALRSVAGLALVSVLTVGVFQVDWHEYSFWLEHAVKSTCLGAWTIWAFHVNTALWRWAGAPAARFTSRNVLGAYSPAEFWRRWDRPMYRWFWEDVYRPAGGRRHPYFVGLTPFVLSALLHEYLFAVTFRRVAGYITVFFLLHGVAAFLTRRVKPTGPWVLPAVLLTFAFNTFSTVFLFLPLDKQIPFYVNDVPKWLHLW